MIIYSLEQERKEDQLYLVVKIKSGSARLLYRDTLLQLAKQEGDTQAVQFLIDAHFTHRRIHPQSSQAETVSFSQIYIPAAQSFKAIELLASTKRLEWKNKSLVTQLQTKTEFFYDLKGFQLFGKLCVDGQEIPIKSCELVFPGATPWFIYEGVLRSIAVDWRWIKTVYPESKQLDQKKLQELKENLSEEPLSPRLVEKTKKEQMWPYLVLKDRTGAFADLWFDYGDHQIASHDPLPAPWRLCEREIYWEKDLLEAGFQKKVMGNSHYYCPVDKAVKSIHFLIELGWNILDVNHRRVVKHAPLSLSFSMENQNVKVEGRLDFENEKIDLQNAAAAIKKGFRFLELSSSTVGLLDAHSFPKEVIDFFTDDKESLHRRNFGLVQPLLEMQGVKKDEQITQLQHAFKNPPVSMPPDESFKGILYPYQQQGLDFLKFLYDFGFHGLLADEMGLGKTVQVLAFLSHLKYSNPILIVVPTSLVFNWRKEIEKFLPHLLVYEHQGKNRTLSKEELEKENVIITSYALLRLDASLLQSLEYECIILDEAQYIKNPQSAVAKASFLLRGKFRLAITGTPIENRLEDLGSIFHFLMPELLDEITDLSRLQKKIRPYILRRTKEIIAGQLPEKVEQTVWVEMHPQQKLFYDQFLQKSRTRIHENGLQSQPMQILETLLRLRQICCHPQLVDPTFEGDPIEASGKLERFMQDLEAVAGEKRKVLIYSQFTEMLKHIRRAVEVRKIPYVYLDGETKNREQVVEEFQENPDVLFFLISLKAGGVGLNLTEADYVFIYDPWWNEAAERQAIDRAHRIGRKGTLIARRYVTAMTLEEKMMVLKEHKSTLLDKVFDSEDSSHSLNVQELYELLN